MKELLGPETGCVFSMRYAHHQQQGSSRCSRDLFSVDGVRLLAHTSCSAWAVDHALMPDRALIAGVS